jgi:predicted N-acetyltransferase YhbS
MDITIRLEAPGDWRETENLTREAFWDVYKPGCDEHLVLHKLRRSAAFVPGLDFVACDGARIVGNIVYSTARVVDAAGGSREVLCLGPVCALPACQKTGIGSRLIRHSMAVARDIGYAGVVLMGNPAYYGRFGFAPAEQYGITDHEGKCQYYLLAHELAPGRLQGTRGRFCYDEAFHAKKEELEEFERGFPPKEKHVTATQLRPAD